MEELLGIQFNPNATTIEDFLCLTEDQTEVLKNKIINDLSSIIKNKEEIIGVPLFLEACIKNATTINEAIYASFLVGAASQDTYSHKDSLLIDNY